MTEITLYGKRERLASFSRLSRRTYTRHNGLAIVIRSLWRTLVLECETFSRWLLSANERCALIKVGVYFEGATPSRRRGDNLWPFAEWFKFVVAKCKFNIFRFLQSAESLSPASNSSSQYSLWNKRTLMGLRCKLLLEQK